MTPGRTATRLPGLPVESDPRAAWSLGLGIMSILGIWPAGVVLGPLALGLGLWSLRRIRREDGRLTGWGLAVAGVTMGGLVSVLCILVIDAEVLSNLLLGSPVPAAP